MLRLLFLIIPGSLLILSCNTVKKSSGADNLVTTHSIPVESKIIPNLNGTWLLQSIEGKFTEKDFVQNLTAPVFVEINERISGFAGCNRIANGKMEVINDSIHFSSLATTKKLCEGKSMEIETAFLSALRSCNRFEMRNEVLLLYKENEKLAAFKRKE